MPKTVLLVEDEPLISLEVAGYLSDLGFPVLVAFNGADAIGVLESRISELIAILTDIRLGGGPNGWQVGRRARELEPAMPVFYMSGDSSPDWSTHGVSGSQMLAKPFEPGVLASVMSYLVEAS
jgi:DNA-binding response OmpR family regulator